MRATSIWSRLGIGCFVLATGCAPATSEPPPTATKAAFNHDSAASNPAPATRSSSVPSASSPIERTALRPKLEQASQNKPPATSAPTSTDALDGEWTMSIQPDATVLVMHKGAVVLRSQYITWAEKRTQPPLISQWVPSNFAAEKVHNGRATITGSIPGLDLKAAGSITPLADNALQFDYLFTAGKPHPQIFGAVLDWRFDLDSPSFENRPTDPVFLENDVGWVWRTGPDQSVTVRFDRPLDRIIYEANNKNNIRTFHIAKNLPAGTRPVSFTITLPEGGRVVPTAQERYGPAEPDRWMRDVLTWDHTPIDLSFLNAGERPAGGHGFVKAEGDHFVFEDGVQPRFWGVNLGANALFSTPRRNVVPQAKRLAKLGFNLIRLHQIDADWASPNIFVGNGKQDTRHLNPKSLDALDWWIKCLKDEGIYVWLDFIYNRALAPSDGVSAGYDEIKRQKGYFYGFSYFNQGLVNLMRELQQHLLNHVNPYTKLAYKDDPVFIAFLLTNENDLTHHFGNNMLPDKNNPFHNGRFTAAYRAFARQSGLPEQKLWLTWQPGPNKIFLGDVEHQFNQTMIDDVRRLGARALIATTNTWGDNPISSLPSLTDGEVIDVHSYGVAEEMSVNPRYSPNFITWIGSAQVEGKPLSISEWNTPYDTVDRFASPLYVASIAALQGWDMPALYNYSQLSLIPPAKEEWLHRIDVWSAYNDPLLSGLMPAAALAFRQGHISPARKQYCLALSPDQLFNQDLSPKTSATIRTLVEQSRIAIGIPAVKELPWLKPTPTPSGTTLVTDPNHDFIPAGQTYVRSDTGELIRNWKYGIQSIDTPKTQAVIGWIGGKTLATRDATFVIQTPKAVVALSSLDSQPLAGSHSIFITAVARAVPETPNHVPYRSEPVLGVITLKTKVAGLKATTSPANGQAPTAVPLKATSEGVELTLTAKSGTCWYRLSVPSEGAALGESKK